MKKDDLMNSKISRAACLTELTSNPKSFSNCPDLQGGIPGVRRGRSRSGEILDAAGKHKALEKSKRPRGAKNTEDKPSSPAVGTLERMANNRASLPAANHRPASGAVLDSVRQAIRRCLCRYDIKDVEDTLVSMDRHLPRASVSKAMQRLLRQKEIFVAQRGKGGRATIYKK